MDASEIATLENETRYRDDLRCDADAIENRNETHRRYKMNSGACSKLRYRDARRLNTNAATLEMGRE